VIREADRKFSLGEEASHWLCIDALRVTARLLSGLLSESRLITAYAQLESALAEADAVEAIVFCPRNFMREVEPELADRPLSHSWSVTTDSIAARLAQVIQADELILLKSLDPPVDADEMRGYVDKNFPVVAKDIKKVRFVNLRAWASDG